MPQIAQQDYLRVPHINGIVWDNDMRLLAGLVKGIETKTFFDIVVSWETDGDIIEDRTIGYSIYDDTIFIGGASIVTIDFEYTATQYEGLAAVQEARAEDEGEYVDEAPALQKDSDGFLMEVNSGSFICDEDGHKIIATIADGTLKTVAISDETEVAGLFIPFEEIEKLIGLDCVKD